MLRGLFWFATTVSLLLGTAVAVAWGASWVWPATWSRTSYEGHESKTVFCFSHKGRAGLGRMVMSQLDATPATDMAPYRESHRKVASELMRDYRQPHPDESPLRRPGLGLSLTADPGLTFYEDVVVAAPHWALAALTAPLALLRVRRWAVRRREARRRAENRCTRCGYDLRGTAPGGRCPECGTAVPAGEIVPTDVHARPAATPA